MRSPFPFKAVSLGVGFIAMLVFIYDIGFEYNYNLNRYLPLAYFILLNTFIFLNVIKLLTPGATAHRTQTAMVIFLIGILLYILLSVLLRELPLQDILTNNQPLLRFCSILFFAIEYSIIVEQFYKANLQPAFIFATSFMILIAIGTLLLKLPMATKASLSFVDAVFMATSAVCVTGLSVSTIGQEFTMVGQVIIMLLIQAGGIGILTFTSFFAYFFKTNLSFRESLFVRDFINSDNLSNIFRLTVNIVALTAIAEGIGAVLIYIYTPMDVVGSTGERIFFAVFHSISAFCNAGFSTLPQSFYDEAFRFNYPIHLTVALLFIFGGLGYNIMFNVMDYIREKAINLFKRYVSNERNYRKRARIVTLNSRIVLYTTLVLLVFGTSFFLIAEYDNTLAEHQSIFGKIVTAFFGAATPRTAGFNTVNTSALNISTLMVILLLMWIGASPASTGGGIKTSTFAIATLNIFSIARGRTRITLMRRVISDYSARKTSAIISLSLIFIGSGVFLISTFEAGSKENFLRIAFECFSAYSTVGLSLGITDSLTDASKVVLILLMFIGRVGAIYLLIGLLRRLETSHLRYPEEDILIN